MYSDEKFKLLREKVVLQAECLIVSHLIDNGIKIQKHITTKFIRNQDTYAVNFTVEIVRKKIPNPNLESMVLQNTNRPVHGIKFEYITVN